MLKKSKGLTLVEVGIALVIIIIIGGLIVGGISKMFLSKTYEGTVTSCNKLDATFAEGSKIFSFSVEIETDVEIINFSSEDRQFASIKQGDNIKVKVFQYPPWNFTKAGTLYGGRLLKKFK